MNFFKKLTLFLLAGLMLITLIPCTLIANAESGYARAQEMSDDFRKILTNDKLVLNCIKPTSKDDELMWAFAETFNLNNPDFFLNPGKFTSDFSNIELKMYNSSGEEVHNVDVVWNYDADVLAASKSFVETFPDEWANYIWLEISDLELVNYWVYKKPGITNAVLANFSSEFKSALGESNFYFEVQRYGGGNIPFYTANGGTAKLMHNGSAYQYLGGISARANHAIYVPESTADTKEALIAAAQKRIDDYIGKNIIKITDSGETLSDYKDEYADDFLDDGAFSFTKDAVGEYVFNVEILGKEDVYKFVIIKDDTKLAVPAFASTDFKTNVSVSTDSSEVPLDAVVKVEKITHGEEHERICGVLEIKDGEIFDIKLHSGSLDDYISQLKNGKFKVRLPIPKGYEKKNLVVYYVDANGEKTKYNVTIKNNFAFFETDHFSIYTLAVEGDTDPTVSQTSDNNNILLWFALLFVSSIGLAATVFVKKKVIE